MHIWENKYLVLYIAWRQWGCCLLLLLYKASATPTPRERRAWGLHMNSRSSSISVSFFPASPALSFFALVSSSFIRNSFFPCLCCRTCFLVLKHPVFQDWCYSPKHYTICGEYRLTSVKIVYFICFTAWVHSLKTKISCKYRLQTCTTFSI